MTKNLFNAKKMLMSTIAAVVFSFVFATNANASTSEDVENESVEIRQSSDDNEEEDMQDIPEIIAYILDIFGVRV
jgi:hypothetical protein